MFSVYGQKVVRITFVFQQILKSLRTKLQFEPSGDNDEEMFSLQIWIDIGPGGDQGRPGRGCNIVI